MYTSGSRPDTKKIAMEIVMTFQHRSFYFIGSAFLLAAGAFAENVKTDYDRAADFNLYKTYSWENVHTENPLWVSRIKGAVNSALAARGWTEVKSGGKASIMAMEMTRSHQTLNTFYDSFGGGWGWRGWFGGGFGDSTTTEETYEVGTLVVDLFDSNTKKLIWRGSVSDTLSDKSDKNIKNLDKGVDKMFEHFPPPQSER
jgi:hypothetical protein